MIDARSYRENGYVLLKSVFRRPEMDVIRDEAKWIFAAQMLRLGVISSRDISEPEFERGMFKFFETDLQCFTNCGKQAQHLVSLHRLSLDERIIRAIRELGLDFPNVSTRPLLYFRLRDGSQKKCIGASPYTRTGAACRVIGRHCRLGAAG